MIEHPPFGALSEIAKISYQKRKSHFGHVESMAPKWGEMEWLRGMLERGRQERFVICDVELTPTLANLLVAKNPLNRNPSFINIRKWANDIVADRWKNNGQPIIIANTGEMNTGQNRCFAVIAANKSIITSIAFGYDRDSRFTLDTGTKKTAPQNLHMKGYANANSLSQAATLLIIYEKFGTFSVTDGNVGTRPSESQIEEWIEKNPFITECIQPANKLHREFKVSLGMFTALYWAFSKKSQNDANRFFDYVATGLDENGNGLNGSHPAFVLRSELYSHLSKKAERVVKSERQRRTKTPFAIAALTIKAWNYCRINQQIKRLSVREDEIFPIPK